MALTREEFVNLALAELDAVNRVACRLVQGRPESDDLVQETYLRALRSWETFRLQVFGMRPWLLRILHNLFINRAKRESRQPQLVDVEILQASPDESVQPLPLDGSLASDGALAAAMGRLSPDLRAAILLWAVEELSYKEIAAVLDVPMGTVMSRLFRARQRLAELLADEPGIARRGNSQLL